MTSPQVYFESSGPADAPVLVLSNSIGTTIDMWSPQLEHLAKKYRVIRYDHRGHGRSPVVPGPYRIEDMSRDVIRLLDRLAVQRVSFCGISLGGMVGIWLAAHEPQRIDRLILCCTTYRLPAQPWLERAQRVRREGTSQIGLELSERWFTEEFARSSPEVVERIRQQVEHTSVEGLASACEALAGMDLTEELTSIQADTLVLSGAFDVGLPPALGAEMLALIQRGRTPGRHAVVDHAAHLASLEQPEVVSRLVAEHLAADQRG